MEFLTSLWLPILATSIALFFISAMAWMVLPHHKADYKKFEGEDELLKKLTELNIPPGRYTFPFFGSNQNSKDPEFQKKFREGPVGVITVFGQVNMGKNMMWTFIALLGTTTLLAYLAWLAIAGGDQSFMRVFRIVGTAGVLAHTCSSVPNDIWFKRPLVTNLIDGIVYGIVSGLIFAALWPK
jgi:hypothetical protein